MNDALPTAVPTTMRAVVARRYGGPERLELDELTPRSPESDEVLIEVAASSLNALDWHMATGTPYFLRLSAGLRRPKRIVLGADVAGTVVAVGPDVTEYSVGDRVFGETEGGGFAEFCVTSQAKIARLAHDVPFEVAAATPVAGLTALQGLHTRADLQAGESVLINGAAGGVGTMAVQIAVAAGADVTAVCSTRNVEMVQRLGAGKVVD